MSPTRGDGADSDADGTAKKLGNARDTSRDDPVTESRLGRLTASTNPDEVPGLIDRVGSLGIGLGIISIALASVGLLAGWLDVQPAGNIALVGSLILITVAMALGFVYQIAAVEWPTNRD